MQASTYFPMVRRMLLFDAPLILTHFWPASTLLRGHLALATLSPPENDPQNLERWGYAHEVHLDKCNRGEGFWSRILVWRAIAFVNFTRRIGFGMSVPFRENRLRRRHVLKYATQLPCIRRLTFRWMLSQNFLSLLFPGFPGRFVTFIGDRLSFLAISFLQHCRQHFCHHSFWTLSRLFINLAMCIRALFPKPTTTLGLPELAFWRVPLFTEWVISSSSKAILARPSRRSTRWDFCLWDFGFSMIFALSAAWKNSETDLMV